MPKKCPDEVRDRAVRITLGRLNERSTPHAARQALAAPTLNLEGENFTVDACCVRMVFEHGRRSRL